MKKAPLVLRLWIVTTMVQWSNRLDRGPHFGQTAVVAVGTESYCPSLKGLETNG